MHLLRMIIDQSLIDLQAGVRVVCTIQLSYRDVLRDGGAYLETHGIFHLFLDTLTIGDDKKGIDSD